MENVRAHPRYTAATLILLVVGVFSNFYRLGTAADTTDEPGYVHAGWIYLHQPVGGLKIGGSSNFEHPPLAKYLYGLAQVLAGHQSIFAARLVAAACTLLTAAVLLVFLTRVAGRWVGLATAAVFILVPQSGLTGDALGRHAMLEPVALLLLTLAFAAAWYWFHTAYRASWVWAASCGLGTGLATSAKETAFLGIVGPILLGMVLVVRDRRALIVRAVQSAVAAVVAAIVYLGLYLPVGSPTAIIRYMFSLQGRQSRCGHLVWVAGAGYDFPPWWANLWFFEHSAGALATAVLCLLAATGIALAARSRLVWWLLAALLPAAIYFCLISPFALPFYWTLWAPPFYALAAIGAVALVRAATAQPERTRHATPTRRIRAPRVATAALLVAALVLAVSSVLDTARLQPLGPPAVARATGKGATGLVLIFNYSSALSRYMPASRITTVIPDDPDRIDYFAVGTPLRIADRRIIAVIQTNIDAGNVRAIYQDRYGIVYQRTDHLIPATAAQLNVPVPRNSLPCSSAEPKV